MVRLGGILQPDPPRTGSTDSMVDFERGCGWMQVLERGGSSRRQKDEGRPPPPAHTLEMARDFTYDPEGLPLAVG